MNRSGIRDGLAVHNIGHIRANLKVEFAMAYALYLNGVFEGVLEEICKAQSEEPGLVCYLQPYKSHGPVWC